MKLTALLLTFCFSLNVMASTGTVQELERHLDEYQYALTVEWDQKDQSFYQTQMIMELSRLILSVDG